MPAEILPLFPLSTVLFPGGRLPLRIFEPRYVDMVGRCMRDGSGFGVLLIRAGRETRAGEGDTQPEIFAVGTRAEIVDFDQLADGLLGVVAAGREKIRVQRTDERPDHLLVGAVERLPEEPSAPLPPAHAGLADVLRQLLEHPAVSGQRRAVDWDDARSVGWRLAELLPVDPAIRQSLLEIGHPLERLERLERILAAVRERLDA